MQCVWNNDRSDMRNYSPLGLCDWCAVCRRWERCWWWCGCEWWCGRDDEGDEEALIGGLGAYDLGTCKRNSNGNGTSESCVGHRRAARLHSPHPTSNRSADVRHSGPPFRSNADAGSSIPADSAANACRSNCTTQSKRLMGFPMITEG